MIIFWVWVPQLGRLPIDSTDETANHGARALLHFGQTKVGDLGYAFRSDENVRGLAVTMDDGGLALM